jgi:NAD(P)-dependent dehydrogenase (short-subunit alcohol dehydrogenase family)
MTALVTGGSGGLGVEVARQLLGRGHNVALLDIDDRVPDVAKDLRASMTGCLVDAFRADISDAREVDESWTGAEAALGPIDVVVNSAGIAVRGGITEVSQDEWLRCLSVNLTGPWVVCRQAARAWLSSGIKGAIVNVASVAAFKAAAPPVGSVAYGSSKAGLVGLTNHLAVELGPHGIRTNAVAPGSFASPMNRERLADPKATAEAEAIVPLHRIGTSAEIAEAILYLALDATYVNGSVLVCDGGTVVQL